MRQGWRNSVMSPHELTPAPSESGQLLIYQDGATVRSFRMVRRGGARDVTVAKNHLGETELREWRGHLPSCVAIRGIAPYAGTIRQVVRAAKPTIRLHNMAGTGNTCPVLEVPCK